MSSSRVSDEVLNTLQGSQVWQTRSLTYQQPQVLTNQSTDPVIFTFPADKCLDFRQSYVQMQMSITNSGGGGTVSLPYPVQCIFRMLEVKIAGALVCQVSNLNYVFGMMQSAKDVDAVNTIDRDGSVVAATRQASSLVPQTYIFRLGDVCELLRKVIPIYAINGPFEVYLYPDVATNVCEYTSPGVPTQPLLTSMKYFYHSLDISPDVKAMIDAQVASPGGLNITYNQWQTQQQQVLSATAQQVTLPFKYQCTKAIITMSQPLANISNGITITPGSRFMNDFSASNIQTLVLRGGSQQWPQGQWQMSSPQSYKLAQMENQAVLQHWSNSHYRSGSTWGVQSTTELNSFFPTFDMRIDSGLSSQGLNGNGWNGANSNNLMLEYTWSVAPGNQNMTILVLYEANLKFQGKQATFTC